MSDSENTLLYGMYGSLNVGDEIICSAVAHGILKKHPEYKIWAFSMDPKKCIRFHEDDKINFHIGRIFHYKFWIYLFPILKKVCSMDSMVVGGGGLFQDIYSWRLATGCLFLISFGIILKKKSCSHRGGCWSFKESLVEKVGFKSLSIIKIFKCSRY